jgi:hypothetical protein
MGEAAAIALLILVCLISVLATAFRLPGTWMIVVAALVYGWFDGWERISVTWILILAGLALLGEAIELLAAFVTARRAGATRQAAWGGLIGGILGMFLLSVPLPLLGTFIGAILGCFIGAAITEVVIHHGVQQSARVGFFSAIGFAIGAAAKVGLALAMAGITTIVVLWPQAAESASPIPPGNPPAVNDQK